MQGCRFGFEEFLSIKMVKTIAERIFANSPRFKPWAINDAILGNHFNGLG